MGNRLTLILSFSPLTCVYECEAAGRGWKEEFLVVVGNTSRLNFKGQRNNMRKDMTTRATGAVFSGQLCSA